MADVGAPVWLAIIALVSLVITTIVAPILVKWTIDKSLIASKAADREQDRKDKEADRSRLQRDKDEERQRNKEIAAQVTAAADQAKEAARLLAEDQTRRAASDAATARLLAKNTAAVAAAAAQTRSKLEELHKQTTETHALVNSSLTVEMTANLNTTKRVLALLRQGIVRDKRDGITVSREAEGEITACEKSIDEMSTVLSDRVKHQKELDQQK